MKDKYEITGDRINAMIQQFPSSACYLQAMFPEHFFPTFYTGARFQDKRGRHYIVVHSPQKGGFYYLASLTSGYLEKDIHFTRDGRGETWHLTPNINPQIFYENYTLTHPGEVR